MQRDGESLKMKLEHYRRKNAPSFLRELKQEKKNELRGGGSKSKALKKKTSKGKWTPAAQMAKEYDQGLRGGLNTPSKEK